MWSKLKFILVYPFSKNFFLHIKKKKKPADKNNFTQSYTSTQHIAPCFKLYHCEDWKKKKKNILNESSCIATINNNDYMELNNYLSTIRVFGTDQVQRDKQAVEFFLRSFLRWTCLLNERDRIVSFCLIYTQNWVTIDNH